MIDHKNHCSVTLTGECNCQPATEIKRTEIWIDGDQTCLVAVNILDETVICSYQYLAEMLTRAGLVKSDATA